MPPRHPAASEPLRKSNETAHRVRCAAARGDGAVGPTAARGWPDGARLARRRTRRPGGLGAPWARRQRPGRDTAATPTIRASWVLAPVIWANRVRIPSVDADWARSSAEGETRARILAVGATRVRPLSIEARKTALDGHTANPEIADGQKPNPGCTDTRPAYPQRHYIKSSYNTFQ